MKIQVEQLRQIIREEIRDVKASLLTEVFQSDTLRKIASSRINRDFFSATAKKYGIEWDKVEDHQIERLRTPKKKGIAFAIAGKNIEYLPSKKRQGYYSSSKVYVGITKGRLIAVLKDGKALYMGNSYRKAEIGTAGEVDSYSKQMVGLDEFGYRSLKAIQEIPALMWYHLDLSKDAEYMGATEKGKLRQAARYGASKFTSAEEFGKQQKERYSKAVAKMKNDPKKIKTMVNKATTHLQKMLKEVLEAKSPAIKKAIKRYKKEYGASYFSDRQYRAASDIASRSENLFRDYSTYLQEANRSAMMRSDEYVNRYAETVVNDCRNIMKLKAVDYL